MRKPRIAVLLPLFAVLLSAGGCVELEGQRVSWSYDEDKDELQILLHYDGVHDSGKEGQGYSGYQPGADQIPPFVENGDIMLWDWPFHISMKEMREKVDDADADPMERKLAQLMTTIETQAVGYYREPNGEIGAAQLVTIPNAKQFIRGVNALINEGLTREGAAPDDNMPRTLKRIQAAAKEGHQWIRLDGHAIRVTVPVHPGEWQRAKREVLEELAEEVVRALGDDGGEEGRKNFAIGLALLSSAPLSYIDRGHRVEFIIGRTKTPNTLRVTVRDEYEPSLEKTLVKAVKTNLDDQLATALLDNVQPSAAVAAVLAWGPPEERARALIAAAETDDAARKRAALKRLDQWAKQWNREGRLPEALAKPDEPDEALAAWRQWYQAVKWFPVEVPEP